MIRGQNLRFISSHNFDLSDCKIHTWAINIYDLFRHIVFFSRALQFFDFRKCNHIFEATIKVSNEKWATSKTLTRILDPDPENPGPRKTRTLKNLDSEKPGP